MSGLGALAAGVAVFWLADRFDMLAPTFTPPLVDHNAHDDAADRHPQPIEPGKR